MKKKVLGLFMFTLLVIAMCNCNNNREEDDSNQNVYPADSTIKDSVMVKDTTMKIKHGELLDLWDTCFYIGNEQLTIKPSQIIANTEGVLINDIGEYEKQLQIKDKK